MVIPMSQNKTAEIKYMSVSPKPLMSSARKMPVRLGKRSSRERNMKLARYLRRLVEVGVVICLADCCEKVIDNAKC